MIDPEQRSLALTIIEQSKPRELDALQRWAENLLALRDSNLSKFEKARAAIQLTLSSKVIWPAVKLAGRQARKVGWDERSGTARFGLVGAGLGLALFGGQSAGIAALGTAIGLPLWIVLGAGAAFARGLIDEIKGKRSDVGNPRER